MVKLDKTQNKSNTGGNHSLLSCGSPSPSKNMSIVLKKVRQKKRKSSQPSVQKCPELCNEDGDSINYSWKQVDMCESHNKIIESEATEDSPKVLLNHNENTIEEADSDGTMTDNSTVDSPSDLSGDESDHSEASFNIDSYPSDSEDEDDEEDKKRGIPFNSEPSEEVEEKEKRTVFVGNLPKTIDRNELRKWFSRFGKVQCVRLRSAPIADLEMPRKVAVIKKSYHENRSNIHAYIRFVEVEGAKNALQANGVKYGNHTLRVDCAKHEGGYDAKRAVFVGNVPFGIEEDSLMSFFSKCGEIDNVRIIRDKATGVGKGFAYINFKCPSSILLALKLDGEILEKRQLRVNPVKYNMKKKHGRFFTYNQNNPKFTSFRNIRGKQQFMKIKKLDGNNQKSLVSKSRTIQPPIFAKKKNKFQGELSKRKDKKQYKRKSIVEKKREKLSEILQKKCLK